MTVFLKGLISTGCVLGGSCAIGVPIALSARPSNGSQSVEGNSLTKASIDECAFVSETRTRDIKFGEGDRSGNKVCWKVEYDKMNEKTDEASEAYSSLFWKMWSHRDKKWSELEDINGKTECTVGSKQGVIQTSRGDKEYLGNCAGSESWVEIEKDRNGEALKIKLCNQDCGESSLVQGSNRQELKTPKGEGKTVEFKTNKSDK